MCDAGVSGVPYSATMNRCRLARRTCACILLRLQEQQQLTDVLDEGANVLGRRVRARGSTPRKPIGMDKGGRVRGWNENDRDIRGNDRGPIAL